MDSLPEPLILGLVGWLGLCFGSFLNVVIYRLPRMILGAVSDEEFNLLRPRSHCPRCHRQIPNWALIPVIGYGLTKGRCRSCLARISPIYPFVEILCGCLAIGLVLSIGLGFEAIFLFAWTSALLAIALIDLEYLIVPDVLIGVLVILGIAIRALEFLSGQSDFAVVAGEMASGLLVGGGGLYAIRAIGSRIAGREAMGLGDVKLMAAFGIVISPLGLLVLLFVACLIGLSIEMVRRLMTVAGQVQGREIAFAPSLCLAAVIVMVWQDRLVEAAFFGFSAS